MARNPHAERELGGFADGMAATVENSVANALGEWADDYDVEALVADYRVAINAALRPHGVRLEGQLLFGRADTDYTEFDLGEILDQVDFWTLAERHDRARD